MRALDFAPGVDVIAAVDRALTDVAENIDGNLHRVFYPSDDTRYFDWPTQGMSGGGQYADPWRYWLDENDLACLTSLVSGGVTISLDQVFARPWDNPAKGRPYYTAIELDRAYSVQFGNNAQTPQYSIAMGGTWGYGADADPAGTLAANVLTTDDTITVTNGAKAGPGDLVVLGYGRGTAPFPSSAPHAGAIAPFVGERVLITDVAAVATGLTQSGAGVTSDLDNDQQLEWTGTGALNPGEVITLDGEDMLVEKIIGPVATVRRAFNGSTLATHSGAVIYAWRQWSVLRAQLGTTAVTASAGDAVNRHRVPQMIRGLAIAEVENQLLQEGSGYARTVGSGDSAHAAPGVGLADKWAECRTRHGRKARQRTV
ncbi:MAG TPA: hypothetical protein VIL16_12505 [Trebonia sp.]